MDASLFPWFAVAALAGARPHAHAVTSAPSIETTEGLIVALDAPGEYPRMLLWTQKGGSLRLTLDRSRTWVCQNGRMSGVKALRIGQRVKVRYTADSGQDMVRSLMIANPFAVAPASLVPHPWMPNDGGFPDLAPVPSLSPA